MAQCLSMPCHWGQRVMAVPFIICHEERSTALGRSFCVSQATCITLGHVPFWSTYWVTYNDGNFEWGIEQNKSNRWYKALELFDAAGPMTLDTSAANSDTLWSLWQSPKGAWHLGFVMRPSSVTIILYLKSSSWSCCIAQGPISSQLWWIMMEDNVRKRIYIYWC